MIPKVIFFLGRPGSGKGTQVKLLIEKTGLYPISGGDLLRKRAEEDDFIGQKIREILSEGGLIPTPIVFSLWMPLLLELKEKGVKGVVFEGNPRKICEAYMLEELFEMFGWDKPKALYLKISEEEAHKRLEKRGRDDDNKEEIEERLKWFQGNVQPVIDYYSQKRDLIEIKGEQSVKEVEKEVEEKTKSFLN